MANRHPLLLYFGLAFAISWSLWLPRIASEQGWWERSVPEWWHYAAAVGPIAAALIVAALTAGRTGILALIRQYRPSRTATGWLLFAWSSLLISFAAGLVAARLADGVWPAYADIAKASNLPAIGLPLTFLVHLLTFGIGEETGWRGFALPRLQQSHRALPATGLLFLGWALWHVPSFFENPSFRDMSASEIVGWGIGLALGAVFLTWLYNSSDGSLFTVVLWHGLFNTFTASEAGSGIIAAVVSSGVMALALAALVVAGPNQLTGLSRHRRRRMHSSIPGRASSLPDGAAAV